MGVAEMTVARWTPRPNSAMSPKNEPASISATGRWSNETTAVPLATTKNCAQVSPCRTRVLPSGTSSGVHNDQTPRISPVVQSDSSQIERIRSIDARSLRALHLMSRQELTFHLRASPCRRSGAAPLAPPVDAALGA
jgi:hypothetical protein